MVGEVAFSIVKFISIETMLSPVPNVSFALYVPAFFGAVVLQVDGVPFVYRCIGNGIFRNCFYTCVARVYCCSGFLFCSIIDNLFI